MPSLTPGILPPAGLDSPKRPLPWGARTGLPSSDRLPSTHAGPDTPGSPRTVILSLSRPGFAFDIGERVSALPATVLLRRGLTALHLASLTFRPVSSRRGLRTRKVPSSLLPACLGAKVTSGTPACASQVVALPALGLSPTVSSVSNGAHSPDPPFPPREDVWGASFRVDPQCFPIPPARNLRHLLSNPGPNG